MKEGGEKLLRSDNSLWMGVEIENRLNDDVDGAAAGDDR